MKILLSKRFTLRLAAASVIALVPASASLADPTLPDAGAHQHYLLTPNGAVPIGPDFCGDPNLQDAFNQFHFNLHDSAIRDANHQRVPVETLGPQQGAPGLHDGQGAEIRAGGCG